MKNLGSVKNDVRTFYETVGWNKVAKDTFTDAARFEDLRTVSSGYRRQCHLRVNQSLTKGGKYLLDVASGPIQYPEHLTYSEGFRFRICADLSIAALHEARKKLGEKGLYVQCDVVHLPFRENAIGGVVSLHTIYHVPATEQVSAFREIHRVLKPGSTAVVVYSWAQYSLLMFLTTPYKAGVKLLRNVKQRAGRLSNRRKVAEPNLYFHVHRYRWLSQRLKAFCNFDVVVWRSVNLQFLRAFIHPWLMGEKLLEMIYRFEEAFPHLSGRIGAYPMFVIRKG